MAVREAEEKAAAHPGPGSEEEAAEQPAQAAPANQEAGAEARQEKQPARITLDDRGVSLESSDFWTLNSTPEEVIIRFGNARSQGSDPVKISHKIVMNYYNAKRLLAALSQTVKGYEQALESMDIEPKA